MKITFLGATRTVTGSNFLIEGAGKKFLVDCGLHQGRMEEEILMIDHLNMMYQILILCY